MRGGLSPASGQRRKCDGGRPYLPHLPIMCRPRSKLGVGSGVAAAQAEVRPHPRGSAQSEGALLAGQCRPYRAAVITGYRVCGSRRARSLGGLNRSCAVLKVLQHGELSPALSRVPITEGDASSRCDEPVRALPRSASYFASRQAERGGGGVHFPPGIVAERAGRRLLFDVSRFNRYPPRRLAAHRALGGVNGSRLDRPQ